MDKIIRNLRFLFKSDEKGYYEPIMIGNAFCTISLHMKVIIIIIIIIIITLFQVDEIKIQNVIQVTYTR